MLFKQALGLALPLLGASLLGFLVDQAQAAVIRAHQFNEAFETTNVDDLGTVFTREASELSGPLFNDRATMVSDPFTIDDCKSNPFPICCTYHIGTGCLKTTVQKQGTNWMDVTGKKVDPANLLDMHSCDQHQGSRVCKAVIFYGNSIKSVSDRSLEGGSHLKQMG